MILLATVYGQYQEIERLKIAFSADKQVLKEKQSILTENERLKNKIDSEKQVLKERLEFLTEESEKLKAKIEKTESKLDVTSEQNTELFINAKVCKNDLSNWGHKIGWMVLGFFLSFILKVLIWCIYQWFGWNDGGQSQAVSVAGVKDVDY